MKKKISISLVVSLLFSLIAVTSALAGSTSDVGNVPGYPPEGTINWTAWHSGSITDGIPGQVVTEDSTNSALGVNKGYGLNGGVERWVLVVDNLDTPHAVANSSTVTVLLGGLGAQSGNLWSSSFVWDNSTGRTDHGAAATFSGATPCPTITSASASGNTQTINWSGPDGLYYVYRSQNDSGADNGASNGSYFYQESVSAPSGTGTYSQDVADESWYIVIHANSSTGVIDGCHSEEASPTAVVLAGASTTPHYAVPSVTLDWDTLNEVNVEGFNIYRALTLESVPQKINSQLIQAHNPGDILGSHYTFNDSTVQRSNTYYYTIEVVPLDGSPFTSDPLKVTIGYQFFMPVIIQ